MDDVPNRIITDRRTPGHWRVTLNHPPINTIDDQMYDEVYDLVGEIEAEQSLKVVTFESAHPDVSSAAVSENRVGSMRQRS